MATRMVSLPYSSIPKHSGSIELKYISWKHKTLSPFFALLSNVCFKETAWHGLTKATSLRILRELPLQGTLTKGNRKGKRISLNHMNSLPIKVCRLEPPHTQSAHHMRSTQMLSQCTGEKMEERKRRKSKDQGFWERHLLISTALKW